MKITRKHLMIMTGALGVLLIAYSLVVHFFKIKVPEKLEKYVMDVVIIGALGLFMYNRKLAKDERTAKQAEEEAARRAAEEPEENMESEEDENLPHWERHKTTASDEYEEEESDDEEDEGEDSETAPRLGNL